jgi:putative transposase
VELATAEWVNWWNQTCLHGAIGEIAPAEYEANYRHQQATATAV